MAISLVTKFSPYVDELFTQESKRNLLTNGDWDWTGAHSVKIYSVTTANMTDYGRDGAEEGNWSRYGAVQTLDATTDEYPLRKDRSFAIHVDALDDDETGGVLNGAAVLARQMREVIIPEVDSYTYGVMCANAGTKPEAVTLTEDNIYEEILKGTQALDDALVPETKRSIVVTPATYALMKKCKLIIMETDIGTTQRLRGVIGMLDGCNVIKVPAARLPENFGFMVCHPLATTAPVKLESYVMHIDPPGYNGILIEGRICYDAFVLKNKATGIYYQATA